MGRSVSSDGGGSGVNPGEQVFTAPSDVHRIESDSLRFTGEVRVYFCVWQPRSDSLGESAPWSAPKCSLSVNVGGYFEFSFTMTKVGNLNTNLVGYFEICFIMAGWAIYKQD